jgi:hypothetical protein
MNPTVQRAISVATIRELPNGMWEPIVSHVHGHEWPLTPQTGRLEAVAYVHGIWPRVRFAWIEHGPRWFAAMRAESASVRGRAA